MPFEIVRNDIVNMKVDAIVNTANPRPIIGAGTDKAVHDNRCKASFGTQGDRRYSSRRSSNNACL